MLSWAYLFFRGSRPTAGWTPRLSSLDKYRSVVVYFPGMDVDSANMGAVR
jgi:hypothetical protein